MPQVWFTQLMLILVRHGRTALNAQRRLQGRSDHDLDDVGRFQAEAIARMLNAEYGDDLRIVSSPLRRAVATAEAFGRPVEIDGRWIEIDYGVLEGTPVADVNSDTWAQWRQDPDFAPEGGESHRALYARVREACSALVETAREGPVVVVSHVSPIKAGVAWALGMGESVAWRAFVEQASVSRIGIDRAGPILRSFNEVHHLR